MEHKVAAIYESEVFQLVQTNPYKERKIHYCFGSDLQKTVDPCGMLFNFNVLIRYKILPMGLCFLRNGRVLKKLYKATHRFYY